MHGERHRRLANFYKPVLGGWMDGIPNLSARKMLVSEKRHKKTTITSNEKPKIETIGRK